VGGRDIVGKPIRDALPELAGQGLCDLLDEVYHTGSPFIGNEYPLMLDTRDNGTLTECFFNFVYQPIREADGSVSGIYVHAVNVTELVRARREAEAAGAVAASANRAKSEFLAAMSHELRTPLNAIGGHAQLLEMGVHGPLTDPQRDAIRRIERSEQHLLSLINDVLNFAKLEAGRVEYDVRTLPLAELVGSVLEMLETQLNAKQLRCALRIASDLAVRGDEEKVRQIMLNLVSNAIKFTAAGGTITIDSASRLGAPPGVVFVRVSDTGIGIPREKGSAIFDPFVQLHPVLGSPREGTGLGLAISRDLARGMGGDIRVRSEEGRGSVFTVSLLRA
jgi:signal transduction histidine kinase